MSDGRFPGQGGRALEQRDGLVEVSLFDEERTKAAIRDGQVEVVIDHLADPDCFPSLGDAFLKFSERGKGGGEPCSGVCLLYTSDAADEL